MKQLLVFTMIFTGLWAMAQAPVIEGDELLCPWQDGTASIVSAQTYDTHQWYYKYWFLPDDFQPIDGATSPSFTYDWFTYDQALLKVVVTLNGNTFESNVLQIDSWAWSGLVLFSDLNDDVVFDPDTESFLLCQGGSFELSINSPPYDANITWFKDGEPIDGANSSSYTVTSPGFYNVSAAPSFCPDSVSNSMGINVLWNSECNLSIENPIAWTEIKVYPNPGIDKWIITSNTVTINQISISDLTGKLIYKWTGNTNEHQLDSLPFQSGVYLAKIVSGQQEMVVKLIKQ